MHMPNAFTTCVQINLHYKSTSNLFQPCICPNASTLKGVTEHVSKHIVNVRNLCRTLPGQSDLFAGNGTRCALPIEGPGGRVAVLEVRTCSVRFNFY
ncbi:hypothetical protein DPMN_111330 [Dreissena polymorpha]|uniref:Uncharacterized protein n=1 Tax=Dreissena polymorpha TaxID=45954 RepID=A0A9D4KEP6_DREPO|nr:hypothetical protein DPMN_111330 [Dreissena polymorpha]